MPPAFPLSERAVGRLLADATERDIDAADTRLAARQAELARALHLRADAYPGEGETGFVDDPEVEDDQR